MFNVQSPASSVSGNQRWSTKEWTKDGRQVDDIWQTFQRLFLINYTKSPDFFFLFFFVQLLHVSELLQAVLYGIL